MTPSDRQLSKRLDAYLKKSWWTARRAAEHLGVSPTLLSFVRNGKRPASAALRKRIEKLIAA